ncbi:MAG TPA: copper-binding protein [Pyrinomonadaceae bacterium]
MKIQRLGIAIVIAAAGCAGGERAAKNSARVSPAPTAATNASPRSSASPASKDGDYNGKGVVTKIDTELGSVEIDHEDIPDLMPPMRMEFYVSDKKMLGGLKVGDKVDFVLR